MNMKNFNKYAALALTVAGLSLGVAYAANSTTGFGVANGKFSLVTGPNVSQTFTFINTNAAVNSRIYVYDAPGTNVSYVLGAYSNYTLGAQSQTNFWTNYYGVLQTNIYLGLTTNYVSVPATTNFYPLAGVFIVTSNTLPGLGVLTVPFTYTFRYGILVTNDNTAFANVNFIQ